MLTARPLAYVLLFALLGFTLPANAQYLRGIQRSDFDYFVSLLRLDDDQKVIARNLYERWHRDYEVNFLPRTRPLSAATPMSNEPDYADRIDDFRREMAVLQREIDESVETFLDELRIVLREEQAPRLERVRRARERLIWRASRTALPEANVDVIRMIDGFNLAPDDRKTAENIIAEYEGRFIEALKRHHHAMDERYKVSYDWENRWQRLAREWNNFPPDERVALQERVNELWAKKQHASHDARLRLRDVNREIVARLTGALSDDVAAELLRSYRKESYPDIFPDPAHADRLYEITLQIDDLTNDQRAAIELLGKEFRRRHEALCKEMMEAEQVARGGGRMILDSGEAMRTMYESRFERIDLGWKREALNEEQINVLRSHLLPDQLRDLPEWDFTKDPPRRPWNPDPRRHPPPDRGR